LTLKKEDDNFDNLIESIALKSTGDSVIKLVNGDVPDDAIIGQKYSPACYISDSWPGVLYLALKYHADPLKGLLVNANLGGDNVHRGSILGVILGLLGESKANKLFQKLTDSQILEKEIANLCRIYT
jgi:ADP-ribosylglycohydrolase